MNELSILDSLFDTDSVADCRKRILESHSIDITAVYCLHTGRIAGRFDDFVLEFAIAEESAGDLESLDDALVARTIASMRPTPMLNKPDRQTMERLAVTHPIDILAYLENRLYSNRHLAVNRSADFLDPYVRRIHCFNRWTKLAAAGIDLNVWIHWLLELDAKRNLHDLTPPTYDFNRVTQKHSLSKQGADIFANLTESNINPLLEVFETWVFERLKEYEDRDREALAQERWFRGNSMTQPAYVQSWMTNPQYASKKAEADAKKRKKALSGKAVTPKKSNSKIQNLLSSHQALIDSLFGAQPSGVDSVTQSQPAEPVKPKAKPMTAGMLFKRKESN